MRHVLWALGTLAVLGFAMLLGVNWWVSAAYRFAEGYPLASVTGKNDLDEVGGTSRGFTTAGMLVVVLLAFIVTFMLLIGSRTRGLAWIAPLIAVLLVGIVVAIGTTMFESPPPDPGG